MATARVERVEPTYVLELDEDEATLLVTLYWSHITGPNDGWRGVMNRIGEALAEAGAKTEGSLVDASVKNTNGNTLFLKEMD